MQDQLRIRTFCSELVRGNPYYSCDTYGTPSFLFYDRLIVPNTSLVINTERENENSKKERQMCFVFSQLFQIFSVEQFIVENVNNNTHSHLLLAVFESVMIRRTSFSNSLSLSTRNRRVKTLKSFESLVKNSP